MFYDYEKMELDGEIWKDVVDWEEFYEVSNFGRVRTKYRVVVYDRNLGRGLEPKTIYPRIRKPKLNKHTGYLMIGLNGKGKSINKTVHSLVSKTFIENYPCLGIGKGKSTNHKNGIKTDNRLENLEVINIGDNVRHMFESGLTTTNHKVEYEGVVYFSKARFREKNKVSERKMKKMLLQGVLKVVNK